MRCLALVALLFVAFCAQAQQNIERQTTASNVRMTVNNIGLIGNAFRGSWLTRGFRSCEYPAGSGVEHLFQGGLWVGADVRGQKRVATGAIDASGGYAPGGCNFEFTPPRDRPTAELGMRSSLRRNPGFSPLAVSHQDFFGDFTDRNDTVPGTKIPVGGGCPVSDRRGTPLGIDVHVESYNWNFSFINFLVALDYTITNRTADTMRDVAIGFWADGVVRNIRRTPPGGTPFFNKGGNGYLDAPTYMAYEFDATGDPGFTNSYIGLKLLGVDHQTRNGLGQDTTVFYHPAKVGPNPDGRVVKINYNSWQFNSTDPLFFTPNNENERYLRLINSLTERPNWGDVLRPSLRAPNNRSNLISISTLPRLLPGESMRITFGVVLARKTEDGQPNTEDTQRQRAELVANANWAQIAYNGEDTNFNGVLDAGEDVNQDGKLSRWILPAPPDVPLARVETGPNNATLYWSDNAEQTVDPITRRRDFAGYRIYKTRIGFDQSQVLDLTNSLQLYQDFNKDSTLAYRTRLPRKGTYVFEGDTTVYRYKLDIAGLPAGWQHVLAISAYDSGNASTGLQSLESAPLEAVYRVFPGTPANADPKDNKPFVYPNPYYGGAAWERVNSRPEERRLMFANLPKRCRIRVLTQAGDVVDDFEHDAANYRGQGSDWYTINSDTKTNQLSGGEHAWDLLSRNSQIVARGVYLFSVEDLDTGNVYKGRFTVVK